MKKGYYILSGEKKLGPFSDDAVVKAFKHGQISLFDMILHDQIDEWVMLFQHPDFCDIENEAEAQQEAQTASHNAIGLMSEASFARVEEKPKQLLFEEDHDLLPVKWYIKKKPQQAFKFLEIVELLHESKANEQTLVSKSPQGPWEPIIAWKEFSTTYREQYKQATQQNLPDIHLRRKYPRFLCGQNFIFQIGQTLFKAFCLDLSEDGMSLVLRNPRCKLNDTIKVKFSIELQDYRFDAQGLVLSERKVRMPGSEDQFTRYGIRFTHFSAAGKQYILTQVARSRGL